ncbi:MAG: DUF1178 family protein [Burkholderiales bacterium]
MKVLDLACDNHHSFEGWFGSEDDFQSQLARGLVECPMCGATAIRKLLSAPRLNMGATSQGLQATEMSQASDPASEFGSPPPHPASSVSVDAAAQAAWLKMMRRVVAATENVGPRFAEEARRIHYGEAKARSIRGQASRRETESLLDEGISVLPLILPPALESSEH